MRKNVVGMVWLAGGLLAAIVYAVGPDRILYVGIDAIDSVRAAVHAMLEAFAINTFEVMRALALGLLPAFVALCALAHRRGQRAVRPWVAVCVAYLLLLYQPVRYGAFISDTRWTLAFFVVALGCAVMTRRLVDPAPRGRVVPAAPWSRGAR